MRGPRVDVARLLAEFKIETRKAGNEHRGHCPNPKHARKPGPGSWQIRLTGAKAGRHNCYACGFGGGLVVLVKTVLGLENYREAYDWLRQFSGEVVPDGAQASFIRKVPPKIELPALRVPVGTIALWTADRETNGTAKTALEYLEGRGLTIRDVERYAIGATPLTSTEYPGRLIVPIVVQGRLVDYVARLYVPKPPQIPKALSGRRDDGAQKELALWGYDELDPAVPIVHITEGVWGAHAARLAGLPNVISCCGSAWSKERSELLAPWRTIVFIPDGDTAGSKLPARAADLRFLHEVRVAELAAGQQPDTIPRAELLDRVGRAAHVRISDLPAARVRPFTGK